MNSTQLAKIVRRNLTVTAGTLSDYTDVVLYEEMTHILHSVFERAIVNARSGYWCKPSFLTTASSRPKYRIPARSVVGGLEKIDIASSTTSEYCPLVATTEEQASDYETAPQNVGQPQAYVVRGDQVILLPTPNSAWPMRFWYYVRPSKLCAAQTAGTVTAVNTTARTITVNSVPNDHTDPLSPVVMAASGTLDVIHPNGWHELAVVGGAYTLAGVTFTIGGTAPLDEVELGDVVRVADQTDWPALPDDFHRPLADLVSIAVLEQIGLDSKAAAMAEKVAPDLLRFQDLIVPRVKADPPTIGLGGGWGGGGFAQWRGWIR
jgi:hypothetical protein